MGLIRHDWELTPQRGGVWSRVQDRAFELRCMEVYAAMVDCMDQGIGRVLDALRDHGRWDHPVVMYMQDNGACAEGVGRGKKTAPPQRPPAPTLPPMAPEVIQTEMVPKQTRDGYPVRQGYGVLPGDADTYIAYGEAWAHVCNTPFREYKHWVHEGGIATPLIVAGPAAVPRERHGARNHEPVHVIDILPTCLELAGLSVTGLPVRPEGVSLLPALQGRNLGRSTPIFFEHEGNRAVRAREWKLVAQGPRAPGNCMTWSATGQNSATWPTNIPRSCASWPRLGRSGPVALTCSLGLGSGTAAERRRPLGKSESSLHQFCGTLPRGGCNKRLSAPFYMGVDGGSHM